MITDRPGRAMGFPGQSLASPRRWGPSWGSRSSPGSRAEPDELQPPDDPGYRLHSILPHLTNSVIFALLHPLTGPSGGKEWLFSAKQASPCPTSVLSWQDNKQLHLPASAPRSGLSFAHSPRGFLLSSLELHRDWLSGN